MAWNWELLDGPDTITEGPVWDGSGLIYTAIDHNEIRRFDPKTGKIAVVHRDTGAANGLALGPDGTLYACEGGRRAVVAYNNDGERSVLADRFHDQRLNSPNDLVLDSLGRIWFTDPAVWRRSQRPRARPLLGLSTHPRQIVGAVGN